MSLILFGCQNMKTVDTPEITDELFPWEVQTLIEQQQPVVLIDVREPHEFETLHIKGSINLPCSRLRQQPEDTLQQLQQAQKAIIFTCLAGKRSHRAMHMLRQLGYQAVKSMKTGIKGWNDFELPLQNGQGQHIDTDVAEAILIPMLHTCVDPLPVTH